MFKIFAVVILASGAQGHFVSENTYPTTEACMMDIEAVKTDLETEFRANNDPLESGYISCTNVNDLPVEDDEEK